MCYGRSNVTSPSIIRTFGAPAKEERLERQETLSRSAIQSTVIKALDHEPVVDMHTHLYPPAFGTPVPNATGHDRPGGPAALGRR